MKITLPIVASAVILTLALAGCSSGGLPGTSSGSAAGGNSGNSSSGGSGNSGPVGNYSASDLVAILKKVETARNLTGSIKTDADLKATIKAGGNLSVTQDFTASGGKFVPAACGTLLDSLVASSEKIIGQTDWSGASLDATDDLISVAATSNTSGTDAVISKTKDIMGQLASQCPTMTIENSSISIGFTIKPITATTDGSQTFAYEEDITASGTTTKTLTVQAVYGNLYIGDVSLTNPNLSDIEANVNAVIAASK